MRITGILIASITDTKVILKNRCLRENPRPIRNPKLSGSYKNFRDNIMDEHKEKIEVVNVRLSFELINMIDSLINEGIYSSRSEVIRDMCRNYVLDERYRLA